METETDQTFAAYRDGYCKGYEGADQGENPFRSPSTHQEWWRWLSGWGEGTNDADAGREPRF